MAVWETPAYMYMNNSLGTHAYSRVQEPPAYGKHLPIPSLGNMYLGNKSDISYLKTSRALDVLIHSATQSSRLNCRSRLK